MDNITESKQPVEARIRSSRFFNVMAIIAIILIALELFLFSVFTSGLISDLTADEPLVNPFGIFGFFFIVLPFLASSMLEYYAVFRRKKTAAVILAVGSFLICFLFFIFVVISVIEIVYNKESLFDFIEILGAFFALSLTFFIIGMFHKKWIGIIDKELPPVTKANWNISNKERFAIVVILMITAVLTYMLALSNPPPSAHNVRPDQAPFDLPKDATNVSYARGFHSDAFEFDISETGFRQWVDEDIRSYNSSRSAIEIITINEPYELQRCASFSSLIPGPKKINIDKGLRYT
ncbi:MAG: hypothetical protein ABIH86_02975 [Planctomycetota bacterium]